MRKVTVEVPEHCAPQIQRLARELRELDQEVRLEANWLADDMADPLWQEMSLETYLHLFGGYHPGSRVSFIYELAVTKPDLDDC